MTLPDSFMNIPLQNRLGQTIQLAVHHLQVLGHEYVFVAALTQQASSLVAKNAEHFAFQLREIFQLNVHRFEMIELRGNNATPSLWRWRFEWVGTSPLSPRSEIVKSDSLQNQLLGLLNISGDSRSALA
jgi:hypothetical protein